MSSFPSAAVFHSKWRPYQQRILTGLQQHLDDNHLHVVAAPGSGKTVLGLEVVRQLNKPALVLAPTLTIRNQWVERFVEFFLPEGSDIPDWISTDLHKPGLLTCATYQALHCAYTGEVCTEEETEQEEENGSIDNTKDEQAAGPEKGLEGKLAETLKGTGIGTVVVDEAHHLRAQWWKSLISTVAELDKPTIVALTATPPYDVSPLEWDRYKELCGPVDAEIAVPELVLDGNICPHQDCIYFNYPSPEETARIAEFRKNVEAIRRDICSNEEFISALEAHPWLTHPRNHIEEILDNPEYFSSLAIFINAIRGRVPIDLLDIIGVSGKQLPELDLGWLEVLLTGRLFTDAEKIGEWDGMLRLIREKLNRIGAIEWKKVYLGSTPHLDRMLISSANKLESITEIVRIEKQSLGQDLRMVVLTDYIRASEMPDSPQDIKSLNRIGVVPIFEKIRRECADGVKLGILSGSLVVVPKSAEEKLKELCVEIDIDPDQVYLHPLYHDPNYCRLVTGSNVNQVVQLVTRLFCKGGITVLVGTKSLLGEGWDAPAVNSLVLASFVGSYMLSNQMRGRAIRSIPGNPDKTANVWHLVCMEPNSHRAGADLETLERRFRAFVGVSLDGKTIENGIERMAIGKPPFFAERIKSINRTMTGLALDRAGLRRRWEQALDCGGPGRLVDEVQSRKNRLPRKYVFYSTTRALLWQAALWATFITTAALTAKGTFNNGAVPVFCVLASIVSVPFTIKSILLGTKHLHSESSMQQIGEVLLTTLRNMEVVKTPLPDLKLYAKKNADSSVSCWLEGGTSREAAIFGDAVEELLNPINNPRYILFPDSVINNVQPGDYYAVPSIIGQNKQFVNSFLSEWKSRIGSAKIVFTRTVNGRAILLKARQIGLSTIQQDYSQRVSCWK